MQVVFETFRPDGTGWSACFDQPNRVYVARRRSEVIQHLKTVELACQAGKWAVLVLTYEASRAFDPAFRVHDALGLPLMWAGIYDGTVECPAPSHASYSVPRWEPAISHEQYANAIHTIHKYIEAGLTYQVNYTFPLKSEFRGDAWAWYRDLAPAQGAGFSAYVDLGPWALLSLSPELFFERKGVTVTVRPMKGTMPRGRWREEDEQMVSRLRTDPKNRAENVMIVDLLRNDLGRIARAGTVRPVSLFEVETYESILQMTSTIEATCVPGVGLVEIFTALFPCGSVTGAPKISTMGIIRDLETGPRGVYTGAIGFIKPGGDCTFNVAIRTIHLDRDTGVATFGVGGGVTYDSTAPAEYDECLLKAEFLSKPPNDFDLFETILFEDGQYYLLEAHLARMRESAAYFRFRFPERDIRAELEAARTGRRPGAARVRVLLRRRGAFTVATSELVRDPHRIRGVALAEQPASSREPSIFHKTTNRRFYEEALQGRPDVDDIIFWNEQGEITESSIANVVIPDGERNWTPPVDCGLLAGTLRAELIALGEIQERRILKSQLREGQRIYLINSVQSWMAAEIVK